MGPQVRYPTARIAFGPAPPYSSGVPCCPAAGSMSGPAMGERLLAAVAAAPAAMNERSVPIVGDRIADAVLPAMAAQTRAEALTALVDALSPDRLTLSRDSLVQALLERESLASTGIGLGVAVPHLKSRAVADWTFAFGRAPHGIEWDSMDGQPVRLIFLLLAHERHVHAFVRVLSQVVRFIKSGDNRLRLLEAPDPESLAAVLREIGRA